MILKPGDKIFLTLILSALLFFQKATFAFPDKSELQPYGKGVVVDGFARLSEDSAVEYIETYIDDPLEDTIRATYWSPDQELLSYKKLDFTANWNIPDYYEAIDYRRTTPRLLMRAFTGMLFQTGTSCLTAKLSE